MKRRLLQAAFALVGMSVALWADEPRVPSYVHDLKSPSEDVRTNMARLLVRDRMHMIAWLETIVRENVNGGDKSKAIATTAIILLGDLRAEEAAPLLAEHLTFQKGTDRGPGQGPFAPLNDVMPCVVALVKIGSPAIGPVLDVAQASDDRGVMSGSAYFLNAVLGADAAIAVVKDRLKRVEDVDQRRRLGLLWEQINRFERNTTYGRHW